MTQIIGIAGRAGVGKDTVASLLRDRLVEQAQRVSIDTFAHPIREISRKVGLDPYNRDTKEVGVPRIYAHFELTLIDAIKEVLGDTVSEDDQCELYCHFVTHLRNAMYLVTARQDKLIISPRRFCQLLGTEGGRAVRKTFWVDQLKARAELHGGTVIVPDVRFINEVTICDHLIYVDREVDAVSDHASERDIESIGKGADYTVFNHRDLEHLATAVEQLSEDFQ